MALAFGFRPLSIIYYDKQEKEEAPKEKKGGHWKHWGQQKKLHVWEWGFVCIGARNTRCTYSKLNDNT